MGRGGQEKEEEGEIKTAPDKMYVVPEHFLILESSEPKKVKFH